MPPEIGCNLISLILDLQLERSVLFLRRKSTKDNLDLLEFPENSCKLKSVQKEQDNNKLKKKNNRCPPPHHSLIDPTTTFFLQHSVRWATTLHGLKTMHHPQLFLQWDKCKVQLLNFTLHVNKFLPNEYSPQSSKEVPINGIISLLLFLSDKMDLALMQRIK